MSFELYPAIDLKDGQCVRLVRGEMDQVTEYNPDPADQAARFAGMGFTNLHVVDLNGAFAGTSANSEAVRAILHHGADLGTTFAALWARPIEAEPRALSLYFEHPAPDHAVENLADRIS